jgi:hypothetical protein
MVKTFATWPSPVEGLAAFSAVCPCGAQALWEQYGSTPGHGYCILCPQCDRPGTQPQRDGVRSRRAPGKADPVVGGNERAVRG